MITVTKVPADQWKQYSESAHMAVFGKHKAQTLDRIDYTVLVCLKDQPDEPVGYITCRESDSKSVYLPFGGLLTKFRSQGQAVEMFEEILKWFAERYDRVYHFVENDNIPMQKLALDTGFRAMGVRTFKGSILIEYLREFKGEKDV